MRLRAPALCVAFALTCALAALQAGDDRPGLLGTLNDGRTRIVCAAQQVAFRLAADESLHPALGPDFDAEWTGFIEVAQAGRYQFSFDGTVSINGVAVTAAVALPAGKQAVALKYRRKPGAVAVRFTWESEFFKAEPVPARLLTHAPTPEASAQELAERGRNLFDRLNCAACHELKSKRDSFMTFAAPDLSEIGSRTTGAWIAKWLENPQAFTPHTRMPRIAMTETERHDVAAYLAQLQGDPPPQAKPSGLGGAALFNAIGCSACHARNALPLNGLGSKYSVAALTQYLLAPEKVDRSGRMPNLFFLNSDEQKQHARMLEVDPDNRMPFIFRNVQKEREREARAIAEFLVLSRLPEYEGPPPAGNAAHGEELLTARGCLNCHSATPRSEVRAKAVGRQVNELAALKSALARKPLSAPAERGCLAKEPGLAPQWQFSDDDRTALLAFLKASLAAPDVSAAPTFETERALRGLRCIACHQSAPFQPVLNLPDYPPSLTESGAKLRPEWLGQVFNQQRRIRPWMKLRMPQYASAALAKLQSGLGACAGVGADAAVPASTDNARIARGLTLIGKGAPDSLGCIACHDFRGEVAQGVRGPDLTGMHERLRPEFFRRWLRQPGRVQPGTAMPQFFGDVADAHGEAKIDDLWAALSLGGGMPQPPGRAEDAARVLPVKDKPVIVRTALPDSSPRSIAVGLPGFLSYCFDAENCSVRYAWHGEFLDVTPLRTGMGARAAVPLGRRLFTAPAATPLRIGAVEGEPKVLFRGYTLNAGLPEFEYDVDGLAVRQTITAAPDALGLVCTFTIAATDKPLWFVKPDGVTAECAQGTWTGNTLKLPAGITRFAVTLKPETRP